MSAKNTEIVKRIIKLFNSNNYNTCSDYLAENIKWNIVGMPVIHGKSEFIKAVNSLELENFSFSRIKNIISKGNYVVVESTGEDAANNPAYCDIYYFKNGKINELTTYIIDTALSSENN